VLFDSTKLAKSIRRSFVSERREKHARDIESFVAAQHRAVRKKMTKGLEAATTENLGNRVSEWLFDIDELAWANYWLAFASDHEHLVPGSSPIQLLATKQVEMRTARESRRAD